MFVSSYGDHRFPFLPRLLGKLSQCLGDYIQQLDSELDRVFKAIVSDILSPIAHHFQPNQRGH